MENKEKFTVVFQGHTPQSPLLQQVVTKDKGCITEVLDDMGFVEISDENNDYFVNPEKVLMVIKGEFIGGRPAQEDKDLGVGDCDVEVVG